MKHIDAQSDKHLIFKPDETALCQQLIHCDDRVLNISTHIDYYTLLFCELASPDGCVTAVVPDHDHLLYLRRSFTDQNTNKTIPLHQIALRESAHATPLFHTEENAGLHASVCCDHSSNASAVLQGDDLALAPLDFIKIDIEGYEPAALRGLINTIKQSPNLKILCEFSPLALWEAGFSPLVFLEEIYSYHLQLIVRNQEKWQAISFDEMEQSLKLIPESVLAPLIHPLQNTGDQQAIYQQTQAIFKQYQYPRPFLENILLVAPDAWQTVCHTLHIPSKTDTTHGATSLNTRKRWHCRWASEYDQEDLLALFQSAFGHAMPAKLWAWKYANRSNYGVLAHREGKVVAYYGGLPRSLWIEGKMQLGVQICDVMVAPEERGILSRRGAFIQTTFAFLNSKIGPDKTYQIAFGFPSGRHAKLGEKTGFYTAADALLEVEWPTTQSTMTRFNLRTTTLTLRDEDNINLLWHAMQQSLADYMLPQKDAQFLKWRYLEHPTQQYITKIVFSRWRRIILGIYVLKDHGVDQGIELIDLLGIPSTLSTLLQSARNLAADMNRKRLFGWITPAILTWLPNPSASSKITDIYLYDGTPDTPQLAKKLQSKVWLMGGDTDFR